MVQLYFMGRLADLFGASLQCAISDKGLTVSELKRQIDTEFKTSTLQHASIRAAINDSIALDSASVNPQDKIVFLPPVGGG